MLEPQTQPVDLHARSVALHGIAPSDRERSGPRVILLFTGDREVDRLVAEALLGSSAIVLIARSVGDALQIVCGRGRELDLAVLDLDHDCRGMTLLSAVHTCYDELPVLVSATTGTEQFCRLAYANGARACLNKPFDAAKLREAMTPLLSSHDAGNTARHHERPALPSLGDPTLNPQTSHAYASVH